MNLHYSKFSKLIIKKISRINLARGWGGTVVFYVTICTQY